MTSLCKLGVLKELEDLDVLIFESSLSRHKKAVERCFGTVSSSDGFLVNQFILDMISWPNLHL